MIQTVVVLLIFFSFYFLCVTNAGSGTEIKKSAYFTYHFFLFILRIRPIGYWPVPVQNISEIMNHRQTVGLLG
jgi:hypothetical protein